MERVTQMVSPLYAQFAPDDDDDRPRPDGRTKEEIGRAALGEIYDLHQRYGRRASELWYGGMRDLDEIEKRLKAEAAAKTVAASPKLAAAPARDKPAAKPQPAASAQEQLAAERKAAAKPFIDAFGERGLTWFVEGKSFNQCVEVVGREEIARRKAAQPVDLTGTPDGLRAFAASIKLPPDATNAFVERTRAMPKPDADQPPEIRCALEAGEQRFADQIKMPDAKPGTRQPAFDKEGLLPGEAAFAKSIKLPGK